MKFERFINLNAVDWDNCKVGNKSLTLILSEIIIFFHVCLIFRKAFGLFSISCFVPKQNIHGEYLWIKKEGRGSSSPGKLSAMFNYLIKTMIISEL